ncbi:MAG: heme exporter protein CcmD [Hyphomicrobiaceae bacterium]|nr:heme exporter protein CcmD [Hyphomicrobiaceae bacterium]
MLPDLGDHAVFIWTSYAVVACVIAGLAAWLIFDGRSLERQLAELERRRDASRTPRP